MDFFLKNLRETLEAINKLIDANVNLVNTKRIRRCNNIKSGNRSKINFIWRTLRYLENEGLLELNGGLNGTLNPKTYKIQANQHINIEEFISQVKKKHR